MKDKLPLIMFSDDKEIDPCQMELKLYPDINVDGLKDSVKDITYLGKASCPNNNGKYRCLVIVCGILCVVEVSIR